MAASDSSQAQFIIVDPAIGVPTPVSQTGTAKLAVLGLSYRAEDRNSSGTAQNLGGAVFVYCQGSNVASRGQFVHISNNSAVLLASANSALFYPVGLAAGVLSATSLFGWVQVAGFADYATCSNTDVATGGRIAFGSTAGQVGTVTALGSRIHGIIVPVSYGSARSASAPNLTVQLQNPFAIGITASN
jgi:hypothetical protein